MSHYGSSSYGDSYGGGSRLGKRDRDDSGYGNGYSSYSGGGYGGGGGGGYGGRGGGDRMDNLGSGLSNINWDLSKLPPFEKNFYIEHPNVSATTEEDAE